MESDVMTQSDSLQTLQGDNKDLSNDELILDGEPDESVELLTNLETARFISSSHSGSNGTTDPHTLPSSSHYSLCLATTGSSCNLPMRPSSLPESPLKTATSVVDGVVILGSLTASCEDVSTNNVSLDLPRQDSSNQLYSESCVSDQSTRSIKSLENSNTSRRARKSTWYHALTSSYKSKLENFRRVFKDTEVEHENLLVDYACALSKNNNGFLMQGRMYITENWICFYSKIISFEQKLILSVKNVVNITKERTAKVFPNAIQIEYQENKEKYFFTSFGSRDRTFGVLVKIWKNRCGNKVMSPEDFWEQVHESYGDDLGLTNSDDDYVCPSSRLSAEDALLQNCELAKQATRESSTPPPNVDDGAVSADDASSILCSSPDAAPARTTGMLRVRGDDDDIATEESDTTEDDDDSQIFGSVENEDEAVLCSGHEHFPREYVNEVLPWSVSDLFTCIFTDSEFFAEFSETRKTYNISQSAWPDDVDENGEKERTIYYTLTLNNSIGPKISSSVEKQVLLSSSESRRIYIVDAKVRNGGIPYCDSFHVVTRYCLTHISNNQSRLKVTSKVVYDKTIFFPARSIIESSAKNGITEYFKSLVMALTSAPDRLTYPIVDDFHSRKLLDPNAVTPTINSGHISGSSAAAVDTSNNSGAGLLPTSTRSPRQSLRERRGPSLSQQVDSHRYGRNLGGDGAATSIAGYGTLSSVYFTFVRSEKAWLALIFVAVILAVCLSVIYSRFLQLEQLTQQLYVRAPSHHTSNMRDQRHQDPPLAEDVDWPRLLKEQSQLHADQIRQWKGIIDTTLTVIDEMKETLKTVRQNLEKLEGNTVHEKRPVS